MRRRWRQQNKRRSPFSGELLMMMALNRTLILAAFFSVFVFFIFSFFLSHFFFLPSSQTSSAPNETIEKTTAERTRPMKRNDDVVFDVSIGHAVTPVFFFSFLNFSLASMFELESVLSVASMSPSLLGPQFYGEKNGYKWNQVWKAH